MPIFFEVDGEIKKVERIPPSIGRTTHKINLIETTGKITNKTLRVVEGRAYVITRIYPEYGLFWCSTRDETGRLAEIPDFCLLFPDEPKFIELDRA